MTEWKTYKLGELCKIKGGKRLPKGINLVQIPNSHPYIRVRDLGNIKYLRLNDSFEYVDDDTQKTISNYIVSNGDIVLSIVGTIGLVAIVDKSLDKANLTENCVKLIDLKELINRDFLYYYLNSDLGRNEIGKGIVGAVQSKLPIKNIQNFNIKIPSIEEQKQIADILSSLDDKIEVNRKINENLEQQAEALFKSWFVDFEPFKDGKFIDSELGKIPEGWRVGTLSEIADITMGQSPQGSSYNENGDGIIFYQGRTEFGDRFPRVRLYTTEPKRYATPFSILLSVRAPVGDLNIVPYKCCIGRGLASLNSSQGYNSFLFYVMKNLKSKLDQFNGEGTVFGSINKKALENIDVLIPSSESILKFERIVKNIDRQIYVLSKENDNLANQRDTLLPKLMSGKVLVE